MGGFGVFLLLLFLAFVLYMIISAALQGLKGATGLEVIPHLHFWLSLTKKAQDAVAYVRNGCRPTAAGYEEV